MEFTSSAKTLMMHTDLPVLTLWYELAHYRTLYSPTVQTHASSRYRSYRSCISCSYLMSLQAEACNVWLIWICLVGLWNCIHSLCLHRKCFISHPVKMILPCCWSRCVFYLTVFYNGNKSLSEKGKKSKAIVGEINLILDCCTFTRCHFSWSSTMEESAPPWKQNLLVLYKIKW